MSIIIIQARMNSSRLPGKVLLPIKSIPIVVLASKRASNTGRKLLVVTSNEKTDDVLCSELEKYKVDYYRGSLDNVLDRFVSAMKDLSDKTIVFRLTADNIFPDGELLDKLEKEFIDLNLKYLNCNGLTKSGLPYGVSVELMRLEHLREASENTSLEYDLEHVTPYIRRTYGENYYSHYKDLLLGNYRATIDTFNDYIKIAKVFESIDNPINVSWKDLSKKLKDIDSHVITSNPINKLILGGVQFGLDYGINNSKGKPTISQVKEIINQAAANGVEYIDTARGYGNSEKVLGKVLNSGIQHNFKIITKLSPLNNCAENESKEIIETFVRESVFESCVRLKTNRLYCLMLHRAELLQKWNSIVWKLLVDLRNKNYIQKLGVSVQTPEELDYALGFNEIEVIQIPFNIFDYRWNSSISKIQRLKYKRNLTIHTRSSLLQGLLASEDEQVWAKTHLLNSKIAINWLKLSCKKYQKQSVINLCFAYVRAQTWIDGIVVGMETIQQLRQNLVLFDQLELSDSEILEINNSRPILPEHVLNPSYWSS
jgi:spore coat polysaccharide biosynthesis protein SpsF (cytidylyltransferase family)/aryl-alcohol dehydrogenase-like predicted oxidoreductase